MSRRKEAWGMEHRAEGQKLRSGYVGRLGNGEKIRRSEDKKSRGAEDEKLISS